MRIERHDLHFGCTGVEFLHDRTSQRHAHLHRQRVRVLRACSTIGKGFDHRPHVAQRHPLFEQIAQNLLHRSERQGLGYKIFDQFRHVLCQMIEQGLRFLSPKEFGSMREDQMIEVRGDNRARIDDRIAIGLRLFARRRIDPYRRQAEGRIRGCRAGHLPCHPTRIDRQQVARERFSLADLDALEEDLVGVWLQFEVVAYMNRRHEKANVLRELLADTADAAQQLAILRLVDQRNQPVADLEPENVERRHVRPARFLHLARHRRCCRDGQRRRRLLLLVQPPGGGRQRTAKQKEDEVRHAGNQTEQTDDRRRQVERLRIVEQLRGKLL
ncbi:MAG: hypothetical protein AW07_00109 [Candidatus Accumulibacter sp. SK-11]|nr:MAG: hypothetical protein AW07_00109 [Candidatus Accumulibacter sp. SK-11]